MECLSFAIHHMLPVIHVHSYYIFLDVSFNKLLNKQSSCQLFETPWRLCDVIVMVAEYTHAQC